jgi:hypothetical protein
VYYYTLVIAANNESVSVAFRRASMLVTRMSTNMPLPYIPEHVPIESADILVDDLHNQLAAEREAVVREQHICEQLKTE